MRQRPTGIMILAGLAILSGAFGIIATLISAATGGTPFLAALALMLYAIVLLGVGYGFFTLEPWAWPLGVALELVGMTQALLRLAAAQATPVETFLAVAVQLVILWYLFRPHVRAAFRR